MRCPDVAEVIAEGICHYDPTPGVKWFRWGSVDRPGNRINGLVNGTNYGKQIRAQVSLQTPTAPGLSSFGTITHYSVCDEHFNDSEDSDPELSGRYVRIGHVSTVP